MIGVYPSNIISSLEQCLGPHVSVQHDQEEGKVNSIEATVLDPVAEWVHSICKVWQGRVFFLICTGKEPEIKLQAENKLIVANSSEGDLAVG